MLARPGWHSLNSVEEMLGNGQFYKEGWTGRWKALTQQKVWYEGEQEEERCQSPKKTHVQFFFITDSMKVAWRASCSGTYAHSSVASPVHLLSFSFMPEQMELMQNGLCFLTSGRWVFSARNISPIIQVTSFVSADSRIPQLY